MPRRRKLTASAVLNVLSNILGASHPVASSALTVAKHSRVSQGGHYSKLGAPLTNYKQPRVIGGRLTKSSGVYLKDQKKALFAPKKILHKSMAYRRRGYKRRARPRRRRLSALPPLALPRSRLVRFRQVFNTGLGGASGTIQTLMFKANSLNDAGGTATAILPLGLDQWAGQYQKYIVLGSKITATGAWTSTGNTGPCVIGVHLDDDNTALTSAAHYRSMPLTKQRILSASRDIGTITLKYSGKRFWKLSNIKDDSEQEAAFSTTPGDPTDIAYYHLFLQDINGASTVNVDFQVSIEFICLLTDPVTLAESSL